MLARYPDAIVISIDLLERRVALHEVHTHLWARIKYEQLDAIEFTLDKLHSILEKLLVHPDDITGIHFSMDCRTYSGADCGTTGYRLPEGTPNPGARRDFYALAVYHDKIVTVVMDTIYAFVQLHPTILVSCENPIGMWQHHPSIKRIIETDDQWRLMEVHYCSATDKRWDANRIFTKKPTHLLLYGVRNETDFPMLPQCQGDCPFRFPIGSGKEQFHLRAIRIDNHSVEGQVKQSGTLRHAIPCGLFHLLLVEHEQWLCARDNAIQSRIVSQAIISVTTRSASQKPSTSMELDSHSCPTTTDTPKNSEDTESDSDIENNATGKHKQKQLTTVQPPEPMSRKRGKASLTLDKPTVFTWDRLTRGQKLYLLLHYRFGHAAFKRLQSLGIYKHIINKHNKVECPICHAAKATYKPHLGRLLRMCYALGLVYFDIQGPMREADIDGTLYNLVLVDDYTDRQWLYRLKTKDQLGSTLRQWIAFLGVCPERLRHDGAGENIGNNGFNSVVQLCYERGIYPERIVPYQPQQLSRVERKNRTNLECARSLMLAAEAGIELNGYAFMHAAYLDQFLSSSGICPYERWFGHPPSDADLNRIRTWGSIVYFTHHEDRHKLQMPGHSGQFLGYCPLTDGCYIRDLDNARKPVRITRDVLSRSFTETEHLVRGTGT